MTAKPTYKLTCKKHKAQKQRSPGALQKILAVKERTHDSQSQATRLYPVV
jgi:hypothetical protein